MHEDEPCTRTSSDFGEGRIISRRPVTSLMSEAPSPIATSATADFDVSIEIGILSDRDRRPMTG